MPTIGYYILFNSGSHLSLYNYDAQKFIFLLIFIATCVAPVLFLPFFLYRNIIESFRMESHKERVYPLLLSFVFYLMVFYLMSSYQISNFLKSFILGSAISVGMLSIISWKWKISAHMAGIGGLLGLIFVLSVSLTVNLQTFTIIVLAVSGLLGFARLQLNEHSPIQVFSGFLIGFISVFLSMIFY